jgi:hypothetical protein
VSFDTFANFKIEVADWLNRADLTSKIPGFIQFADAHLNRKLRVRQMITRATSNIVSEYLAVPSDFKALYDVRVTSTTPDVSLTYMSPSELRKYQNSNVNGVPRYYTIVGSSFEFGPIPDQSYAVEIIYWATIPAMVNANDSNWVLAEHPDLYLYTTLKQAAPYLQNDERIVTWGGLADAIVEDMLVADEKAVKGGVPMKARIKPYVTGQY